MTPTPRRVHPSRAAALALACGSTLSLPALGADLPIRAITLHRSGVASIERSGSVTGDESIALSFGSDQINDILKSLVFVDDGGGRVESVRYGSRDPLDRRLAAYALNIGDNPNIAELINRLRGTPVRLQTPEGAAEGTVLGVEHRKEAGGDAVLVDRFYAKLVTAQSSIRMVPLADLRGMDILDTKLAEELGRALGEIAAGQDERTNAITLALRGDGARRITLGYVQEAPVWKTSYRLVLPEDGSDEVFVQGWAIVENTTDEDWRDIRLSLVAGQPVGFTMDLATPVFAQRPELPVPVLAGIVPRVYAAAVAQLAGRALESDTLGEGEGMSLHRASKGPSRSGTAPASVATLDDAQTYATALSSRGIVGGAPALAEGVDAGRIFAFDLSSPVTIERQGSAMLPIMGQTVSGRSVSVFNSRDGRANPMRAVELKNTAASPLMAGPVTVYDGGTYAGDSPMDYVPAGDTRLLGYAVDLEVRVTASSDEQSRVERVRIIDGVLERTSRVTQSTTYTIENKDESEARTIIIEHARLAGWERVGDPTPTETTEAHYRYEQRLEPGKNAALTATQERIDRQGVAVLGAGIEELVALSRDGRVSKAVIDAVREAGRLQAGVNEARQRVAGLEAEEKRIFTDQQRIRENLGRVERGGDLHARYTRTLDEQETRLADLREEADAARSQAEERQAALQEYLRNLDVE